MRSLGKRQLLLNAEGGWQKSSAGRRGPDHFCSGSEMPTKKLTSRNTCVDK